MKIQQRHYSEKQVGEFELSYESKSVINHSRSTKCETVIREILYDAATKITEALRDEARRDPK